MPITPYHDPDDFTDLDALGDLDDFECADPYGPAVVREAVGHRYRLRVLVSRSLQVEAYLRDEATPGERAAYEAAADYGRAYLAQHRDLKQLVHHFWNDPQCVAPAPGETPRLVEPAWIVEARRLHGGEHKLSTMGIEALGYGRRLGEIVREYLDAMLL